MNRYRNELKPVEKELNDEMLASYPGERTGWYYYGPKKYFMPSTFVNVCDKYLDFKTRPDDVWIATFPRTGTTLTQELVWLITHNLDYETAKKVKLWDRVPFFEFELLFHPENMQELLNENVGNVTNQNIIKDLSANNYLKPEKMKSPRTIKTHFPLSMLPTDIKDNKAKIVYVARNPKDVALSFYHLLRTWKTSRYCADFNTFIKQFERGAVLWAPFWEHVQEGWERRNDDNVIFLFYEDMVKDMKSAIKKLAKFLSVSMSEKEVEELAEHINIKNFSRNPAVNFEYLKDAGVLTKGSNDAFVRKGTSRGDGSEYTDEILEHFNKWIEENSKRTNIKFPSKK